MGNVSSHRVNKTSKVKRNDHNTPFEAETKRIGTTGKRWGMGRSERYVLGPTRIQVWDGISLELRAKRSRRFTLDVDVDVDVDVDAALLRHFDYDCTAKMRQYTYTLLERQYYGIQL